MKKILYPVTLPERQSDRRSGVSFTYEVAGEWQCCYPSAFDIPGEESMLEAISKHLQDLVRAGKELPPVLRAEPGMYLVQLVVPDDFPTLEL